MLDGTYLLTNTRASLLMRAREVKKRRYEKKSNVEFLTALPQFLKKKYLSAVRKETEDSLISSLTVTFPALSFADRARALVRKKERCSGSYCQAVGFLVIKDDSISKRPG